MSKISELSDDLLVKILSFLPTKVAVSTSVLSKQWEFLWMWLPNLKYFDYKDLNSNHTESSLLGYHDFIYKNLPLHRAPIIESLRLKFYYALSRPEDIKLFVGIAVSRRVRKLSISYNYFGDKCQILLPSSLYTCKSLMTLKLYGKTILVDVPPTICLLPSLKTLELGWVTYLNEDSLGLLLSHCPVLEDLSIKRGYNDNVKALVVVVPSLQRLSIHIYSGCSSDDGHVIVTPSLKYFKLLDSRDCLSYLIEHMPELEEADINVKQNPDKLLVSITSIKRLSLNVFNSQEEPGYHAGIVFNHLEHLELCISNNYGYKLLVRLLKDSPKLRVLSICVHVRSEKPKFGKYKQVSWSKNQGSVPKYFLNSLETFKFKGYNSKDQEDRDFMSLIFKHARCLKSTSILHG
ncbi:unnamed protein product [Arabidopsis halleri]